METLKSFAGGYEDSEVSEQISAGIRAARTATGIDVSDAEVKDLPGDIAGEYHLDTKQIRADVEVMTSENRKLVEHVLTHEAWHAANKERGDKEVIRETNFEEALTEAATAQTTGQIRAYQEHAHLVDEVAVVTGGTRGELIELFMRGENEGLNERYEQTYEQEEAKAA